MQSIYLPRYTAGHDAYDSFQEIMKPYGTHCGIFYGEKAWQAAGASVQAALKKAGIEICAQGVYGKEATVKNAEKILHACDGSQIGYLIGVGGGKCIDTVKYAGYCMHVPVFTCPTIGSNCAPVTKISILYHEDGSFDQIVQLREPPAHCFINTRIICDAPAEYLWAGIGDTMAKHVESVFSARGDELAYPVELGLKIGELCYYGMLKDGRKAYADSKNHVLSFELEKVIQNIIITTGAVSVTVGPDYNSALAHALYYGLTVRKDVAENHLHGEIVSYGTLVQLMMDHQAEMLKEAWHFNKSIGLPVRLQDLGLSVNEDLSDILDTAENNQELKHVPYRVSRELILASMKKLEEYDPDAEGVKDE